MTSPIIFPLSKWWIGQEEKFKIFAKTIDPLLLPYIDWDTRTLTSNNELQKAILGPPYCTNFNQQLFLCRTIFGAISCNRRPTEEESLNHWFECPTIAVTLTPTTRLTIPLKPTMHGWYYYGTTRDALEGCILYFKPKIVVELGVWYGMSTCGMFQADDLSTNQSIEQYYGWDMYNAPGIKPDCATKTPIDELVIKHPRMEQVAINLSPYVTSKKGTPRQITLLKDDVYNAVTYCQSHKIMPDLVFIDAIKQTDKLVTEVIKWFKYNPNVVLVGDDYVFDTVKRAYQMILRSLAPRVRGLAFSPDGYALSARKFPATWPKPLSSYTHYDYLHITADELNKLPRELIQHYMTRYEIERNKIQLKHLSKQTLSIMKPVL